MRNEDIAAVKVCASIFRGSGTPIAKDELESLRKETGALYDQISTTEIESDLKKVLLDCVQKIKQAIHDYQLCGADGLEDTLASVVGTVTIHRSQIESELAKIDAENSVSKNKNEWFTRLRGLVATIGMIVQTAEGIGKFAVWTGEEGHRLLPKL